VQEDIEDYTGIAPTELSKQTYAVRPLPLSLDPNLVIDFDELSENQEGNDLCISTIESKNFQVNLKER